MFPDPEALYARLTSGDVGSLDAVAATLGDAKSSLQAAANSISDGTLAATSGWSGSAATQFVDKAKGSTTAAADVYRRLHTAQAAVTRAGAVYRAMQRAAEATIKPWRTTADTLDEAERLELAKLTVHHLRDVREQYEGHLTSVAADLQTKTDPGGGGGGKYWDEEDWQTEGNLDISDVGNDVDEDWTVQGLAYDEERGDLMVTSYDGHKSDSDLAGPYDKRSRLTYVDHETGEETGDIYLGGKAEPGPLGTRGAGHGAPTHSGGIATDGKHTWVSSNGMIYVYDSDQLRRAAETGDETPVPAKEVIDPPGEAASYVSYAMVDGKPRLFVGEYEGKKLHEIGVDGNGIPDTTAENTYETPERTQGVLVRDDEFVFTSSNGHNGKLVAQDRDWDGQGRLPDTIDSRYRDIELDGGEEGNEDGYDSHGIENIIEIDGEIIIAHESGGVGYHDGDDGELGTDDDLPGSHLDEPELTRTPLDELDLDPDEALSPEEGGYETDPDSLSSAATTIDGATSTLQSAARSVSALQLTPGMLGEVPAASKLATAVTKSVADAGAAMNAGATEVATIADGLVAGAKTYRRLEDGISSGLDKFRETLT